VKECIELEVDGKRPRGTVDQREPGDMVKDDMNRMHLLPNDVEDRAKWRRLIHGRKPANQGYS
jgi:hypothetical protein